MGERREILSLAPRVDRQRAPVARGVPASLVPLAVFRDLGGLGLVNGQSSHELVVECHLSLQARHRLRNILYCGTGSVALNGGDTETSTYRVTQGGIFHS